ncbi:threonine--tRNA ligase, partial [bacterium]
YARKIYDELFERDFRVEIDDSDERIGYKIRAAENRKIPYMIIVGAKEEEANNISVRKHLKGDIGSMTMAEFIEKTSDEIKSKI